MSTSLGQRIRDYARVFFANQTPPPLFSPDDRSTPVTYQTWLDNFGSGTPKRPQDYRRIWLDVVFTNRQQIGISADLVGSLAESADEGLLAATKITTAGGTRAMDSPSFQLWVYTFAFWCNESYMKKQRIIPSDPKQVVYLPHDSVSLVAVLSPIVKSDDVLDGTSTKGGVVVINNHDSATEDLIRRFGALSTYPSQNASVQVMKHEFMPGVDWRDSWDRTREQLLMAQQTHPELTAPIQRYATSLGGGGI
jgi:hypothetical protein